MMTTVKRAINFVETLEDKTLTLNAVSRAQPTRFGEEASEARSAMAAGVAELQGTCNKSQWREVLTELTASITEDGKTIPSFEGICAPSGRAGLKQIRAHLSKASEECGVVGRELEHKLTSFVWVKTGLRTYAWLPSLELRSTPCCATARTHTPQ